MPVAADFKPIGASALTVREAGPVPTTLNPYEAGDDGESEDQGRASGYDYRERHGDHRFGR